MTSDVVSLNLKDDEDELMEFEETDENFIIVVKNDMKKVGKDSTKANGCTYSHKERRRYDMQVARYAGKEPARVRPSSDFVPKFDFISFYDMIRLDARSSVSNLSLQHTCSGMKLVLNVLRRQVLNRNFFKSKPKRTEQFHSSLVSPL